VSPVAAELDIGLGDLAVGNEQPEAEDRLGEDIENGVKDDLGVDADLAGTIGDTPDTDISLATIPNTSVHQETHIG
jgi:hypothetical protein